MLFCLRHSFLILLHLLLVSSAVVADTQLSLPVDAEQLVTILQKHLNVHHLNIPAHGKNVTFLRRTTTTLDELNQETLAEIVTIDSKGEETIKCFSGCKEKEVEDSKEESEFERLKFDDKNMDASFPSDKEILVKIPILSSSAEERIGEVSLLLQTPIETASELQFWLYTSIHRGIARMDNLSSKMEYAPIGPNKSWVPYKILMTTDVTLLWLATFQMRIEITETSYNDLETAQ